MAEELATLRRATGAALCLECGKCSTLCPLAAYGDFSAARIAAMNEPGEAMGSEAVARCLTCASCEERCPQGVRFTELVLGLRAHRPAPARPPCPHGQFLAAAAHLEAGGEAPARDLSWLGEELEVAEEGEVALFVGCLPLFDLLFRKELGVEMTGIARAAVRTLNHLGIRPVVVAEERCCGHDLLWSGDEEGFQALAQANARTFAERGVKLLVSPCAECCRTWRRDYPRVVDGPLPRVQHVAELLAEKAAAGEVAFQEDGTATVTFHDPCRLGRQLGVVDEPRQILDALPGLTRVEMERSGRDSACCGTPGFVRCDAVSRRLQSRRLAEAAATGADTLLTACPKCLLHFACAQAEDRRRQRTHPPLHLADLTAFAAAHLARVDRAGGEAS